MTRSDRYAWLCYTNTVMNIIKKSLFLSVFFLSQISSGENSEHIILKSNTMVSIEKIKDGRGEAGDWLTLIEAYEKMPALDYSKYGYLFTLTKDIMQLDIQIPEKLKKSLDNYIRHISNGLYEINSFEKLRWYFIERHIIGIDRSGLNHREDAKKDLKKIIDFQKTGIPILPALWGDNIRIVLRVFEDTSEAITMTLKLLKLKKGILPPSILSVIIESLYVSSFILDEPRLSFIEQKTLLEEARVHLKLREALGNNIKNHLESTMDKRAHFRSIAFIFTLYPQSEWSSILSHSIGETLERSLIETLSNITNHLKTSKYPKDFANEFVAIFESADTQKIQLENLKSLVSQISEAPKNKNNVLEFKKPSSVQKSCLGLFL
jgi:hypothetical protein